MRDFIEQKLQLHLKEGGKSAVGGLSLQDSLMQMQEFRELIEMRKEFRVFQEKLEPLTAGSVNVKELIESAKRAAEMDG